MKIWQLVAKEIRFRFSGFVMGLLCVVVAVACLVGLLTLLDAHNVRTEQVVAEKMEETKAEMELLESDFRRITRDLGYNVMVLHEDESLAGLQARGYPSTTMPEDYAFRLGRTGDTELNHLLPVLQRKVVWPEQNREILLSGVMGQVPVFHKARFLNSEGTYKDPIMATIPPGQVDLGHETARELGLSKGDELVLFGETFTVNQVFPRRGGVEDIAVWADLRKVQEWQDLEGRINGILALECFCDMTSIAEGVLDRQVREVLPDAQVLEFGSKVVARAETRLRAEQEHERAIEAEVAYRGQLRSQREGLAAILIPLALAGAGAWIFFLTLGNARERRSEVAILRAIGVDEGGILSVFLLKAAAVGMAGAVLGCLIGLAIGAVWGGVPLGTPEFYGLIRPRMLAAIVLLAPVLSGLAAYLPAARAARTDPALVLMREA